MEIITQHKETARIEERRGKAHVHALAALILAAAGRLENAFHEAGVIRKLRPAYSIDDFLSSFRVLSDQERPVG